MHQPYPSWRSHATLPALIVQTPEDDAEKAALGYYKPGESAAPVADDSTGTQDVAKVLYQTPVKDMEAFAAQITSADELEALKALESDNPTYKGGRRMVIVALDARRLALQTDGAHAVE